MDHPTKTPLCHPDLVIPGLDPVTIRIRILGVSGSMDSGYGHSLVKNSIPALRPSGPGEKSPASPLGYPTAK